MEVVIQGEDCRRNTWTPKRLFGVQPCGTTQKSQSPNKNRLWQQQARS